MVQEGNAKGINLSLLICPDWCFDADTTKELEAFRLTYEEQNGQTDLNRKYSTQLPMSEQTALSVEEYVAGMPPYLRAFLKSFLNEQTFPLDDLDPATLSFSMALLRRTRNNNKGRRR